MILMKMLEIFLFLNLLGIFFEKKSVQTLLSAVCSLRYFIIIYSVFVNTQISEVKSTKNKQKQTNGAIASIDELKLKT